MPKVSPSKASSMMPKTFFGLELTTPALIAAIAYLILAITILMPLEFPVYDAETDQDIIIKYDFGQRLLILLIMSIPYVLSVYTINCMMTGKCMVWSWVVTILTVFWVLLFVLTAIIYTVSGQKTA